MRNYKSFGSFDIGVIARELRIPSICTRRVYVTELAKEALLIILVKCSLPDFTSALRRFSKCGDLGCINFHLISWGKIFALYVSELTRSDRSKILANLDHTWLLAIFLCYTNL